MSRINEKMGLKAQTRVRAATHARSIVSNARCPKCGCSHVIENVIHGKRRRMCGACGESWAPEMSA
jgi:plasmid stability protein